MPKRNDLKIPKPLVAYIAFIAVVVCIGIIFIIGHTLPFDPYHHYGWDIKQEKACPLEELDVTYTTAVDDGPWTIGHLDGDVYWVNEDGAKAESSPIDQFPEPHPKDTEPSSIAWTAEPIAGNWYIELDAVLSGRMFGFVPTYTRVAHKGADYVTVVDDDTGRCKDNVYLPE